MNARYYDPQLGIFISPDPMIPDATNVFDYQRYAYARLNPMRFNDPTGHFSEEQLAFLGIKKDSVSEKIWSFLLMLQPGDVLELPANGSYAAVGKVSIFASPQDEGGVLFGLYIATPGGNSSAVDWLSANEGSLDYWMMVSRGNDLVYDRGYIHAKYSANAGQSGTYTGKYGAMEKTAAQTIMTEIMIIQTGKSINWGKHGETIFDVLATLFNAGNSVQNPCHGCQEGDFTLEFASWQDTQEGSVYTKRTFFYRYQPDEGKDPLVNVATTVETSNQPLRGPIYANNTFLYTP